MFPARAAEKSKAEAQADKLAHYLQLQNPDVTTSRYCWKDGCTVEFTDSELDTKLARAGAETGAWSSKGSVEIDSKGHVADSDIPISMQPCVEDADKGYHESLATRRETIEDVSVVQPPPGRDAAPWERAECQAYEVHVHDGRGNPSVHLRLKCTSEGSELDLESELLFIAAKVYRAQVIGRAICEGVWDSDVEKELKAKREERELARQVRVREE